MISVVGGGKGGFGGGGAGEALVGGTAGEAGFGGGGGGLRGQENGNSAGGGGGGGAGFGGAIFVREGGILTIGASSVSGGSVAGGQGNISADTLVEGGDGHAAGAGLFLQGTGILTFDPATGETTTVADAIADEAGFVASGYTPPVGYIPGSWALTMNGAGTLILSGENIYSGETTVAAGLLQVEGSIAGSATTVLAGAKLGGNGTTGSVFVASGGTIEAGASPGLLTTGSLALASGAFFEAEIDGTGPGISYDQVAVKGTVSLGNATLVLDIGFDPAIGDNFTLIDNDGQDLVSGVFAGLAEGAQFIADQRAYEITYKGGDGNDVVVTAIQAVIIGTPNPDLINGTNTVFGQLPATKGPDIIQGEDGDDQLYGLAGDDQIFGGRGKDLVKGEDDNDMLFGNKGKDIVKGGKGNDSLNGNEAQDKLTGGQGDDAFVFSTALSKKNVDKITDFGKGDDVIQLDKATFPGLGPQGELAGSHFTKGGKASGSQAEIVYKKGAGKILFHEEGAKAKDLTLFAKVDKGTSLHHDDFFLI